MDFARQQRDPTRHLIGIAFVVLVHALVIWALITGLGKQMVEVIKKPLSGTMEKPTFPREAIKAGVQKGQVKAILTIDEKGRVADVKITSAEPPRVFDRVVRETLVDWKCAADGTKYQASVEVNFTLKDE